MRTFEDSDGHQWRLKFTIGMVYRVEEKTGFNITDQNSEQPQDLKTWGSILYEMVRTQAMEENISELEFYDVMDLQSIRRAINALEEEMAFFSEASTKGPPQTIRNRKPADQKLTNA